MQQVKEHRLFCGGAFEFDCRNEKYEIEARNDYRAMLLKSVEALLRPQDINGVKINGHVTYIGPFYFETDDMQAHDIVKSEKQMIENCTDAVFILDNAACPGTVSEIIYANLLKKKLHIFYVEHGKDIETESDLHTPCWYPIIFCQMTNENVHIYPCADIADAKNKVQSAVSLL